MPTFFANFFEYTIASSIDMPEIGIKGHTSVAPIRGCSPLCFCMLMSSDAFINLKAALITDSGSPANVITVRFVAFPDLHQVM